MLNTITLSKLKLSTLEEAQENHRSVLIQYKGLVFTVEVSTDKYVLSPYTVATPFGDRYPTDTVTDIKEYIRLAYDAEQERSQLIEDIENTLVKGETSKENFQKLANLYKISPEDAKVYINRLNDYCDLEITVLNIAKKLKVKIFTLDSNMSYTSYSFNLKDSWEV